MGALWAGLGCAVMMVALAAGAWLALSRRPGNGTTPSGDAAEAAALRAEVADLRRGQTDSDLSGRR